jgi:CheY-like chemotaxis protein
MRILIVDDEKSLRETLAAVFVTNGYDVFTACDGKEALKIYLEKDFDFVLMDIGMPKIDGISAFREMIKINSAHKRTGNPHIVLMTGDVVKLEAAKKGGAKVIGKPFDVEKVVAMFSELKIENKIGSSRFCVGKNSIFNVIKSC